MKKVISLCGAVAVAAAFANPAAAQVAGVYTGTSADGQNITFTVGTDPNSGAYELVSAGISFAAQCRNSTYVLYEDWGFGLSNDINDGKVSFVNQDNYYKFTVSLRFSADGQSATGYISSVSTSLYPTTGTPTYSLFCTSKVQSLSLSLQPADAPAVKYTHKSLLKDTAKSVSEAEAIQE